MKARKLFYYAADTTAAVLFAILLIYPEKVSVPMHDAIRFCAETLIPSLFVYLILAKLIASIPVTGKLMAVVGCEPVLLLLGSLCGAPVGAAVAESLYSRGSIGKKHAEYLCAFTNNVSASFMLGFIGIGMFGDIKTGLRLMIYQLLSSCLTAAVLKYIMFGRSRIPKPQNVNTNRVGLRDAITGSALSMLNICACAVFFMVISGAVSSLLALNGISDAVLRSVLEFSSGCAYAGTLGGKAAYVLCSFACGGTGLSVMLQVRSVTAGEISIKPYIAGKCMNCAFMTAMAFFIG